jgi:hypothetical protein
MNNKMMAAVSVVALVAAGVASRADSDRTEPPLPGPALTLDWSLDGSWTGIATRPESPTAYGVRAGQLLEINLGERSVKELAQGAGGRVRLGGNDGASTIVTFDFTGHKLSAHSPQGELLWAHQYELAIDDVSAVDLDGDGVSEFVVGFNGHGGVLALDAGGVELWSNRSIGDVWNVTGAPKGDPSVSVLTTSASGKVHGFSRAGKPVSLVEARGYASQLRAGDRVYFGGSGENGSVVGTLDPAGWKTQVSGYSAGLSSLVVEPSIPWLGVATSAGNVYVFRADDGTLDGVAPLSGRRTELAWVGKGESAQLIAATREGLRAYSVPKLAATGKEE